MTTPAFILEVNTRVWLRRLGGGTPLSLDSVADSILDTWKNQGFDAIWLMGVWHASNEGAEIARNHEGLQREFRDTLSDLKPQEDITGSPYAVADYRVREDLGGNEALAGFRERLRKRGLKLILDFVPNHTAIDHPWVFEHPEWYVQGYPDDKYNSRGFGVESDEGERVICHGKDPYFPPWTDTAQLDYRNPDLQEALRDLLKQLADICDGVRCDMAMLVLSEVFGRTWGSHPEEFWPRAIFETRAANPDFLFMAEVYWGKDKELLEMGFNLTYDKVPLDQAVHGPLWDRDLFDLPESEHRRRVRFLENHDEPRIASRIDKNRAFAAASWLFSLPTTRLIYEGQLEGAKVRPPVQLLRAPEEPVDETVRDFYGKLLETLKVPVIRSGIWALLETRSAWQGNDSHTRILGQAYDLYDEHIRIFVNWADHRSQCWIDIKFGDLHGKEVVLRDSLNGMTYVRDGVELMMRGLYLDLPPWHAHVFKCEVREQSKRPRFSDSEDPGLPDAEMFSKRFK